MPVVTGSIRRHRRGRTIEVAVGTAALSLAAIAAIVIGVVAPVTGYYWIEAAVWAAAVITAGSIAAVTAARLHDQREYAQRHSAQHWDRRKPVLLMRSQNGSMILRRYCRNARRRASPNRPMCESSKQARSRSNVDR